MKTIYIHCYNGNEDEINEVEGMFDDKGILLDFWYCNDAEWRSEYFGGFMNKLGFLIKSMPKKMHKQANKQIEKRVL